MCNAYSYRQIAEDFELWAEYVATMTEEEFNKLSVEEKIEMQKDIFGVDEYDEYEDYYDEYINWLVSQKEAEDYSAMRESILESAQS